MRWTIPTGNQTSPTIIKGAKTVRYISHLATTGTTRTVTLHKAIYVQYLEVSLLCRGNSCINDLISTLRGYIVVRTRADQLLPQFLMERFGTLPYQYVHIVKLHEEV